jgi:hypothetical protein
VPTLIVHGDDDQIVPIGAAAVRSSKLVGNAALKIYAGARANWPTRTKTSSTPTCSNSLRPPHNKFRVKNHHRRISMPEFGSPFSGLANDRKLTKQELVRAIRFMVAAEYEAVQMYMQLAESTDCKLAVEVLTDIAEEERVHAGEFLRLLREIAPDEEEFYAKGAKEVEDEIKKMK